MKGEKRVLANPLHCRAGRVRNWVGIEFSSANTAHNQTDWSSRKVHLCLATGAFYVTNGRERKKLWEREKMEEHREEAQSRWNPSGHLDSTMCNIWTASCAAVCMCASFEHKYCKPGETLHLLQPPEMAKAVERRPKVTVRKTKAICTHTHANGALEFCIWMSIKCCSSVWMCAVRQCDGWCQFQSAFQNSLWLRAGPQWPVGL